MGRGATLDRGLLGEIGGLHRGVLDSTRLSATRVIPQKLSIQPTSEKEQLYEDRILYRTAVSLGAGRGGL